MGEDLIGFTAIELLNYYFIKLKSLCRLSGWHIKKEKEREERKKRKDKKRVQQTKREETFKLESKTFEILLIFSVTI